MHIHDYTEVSNRLAKIEGHVRGIRKMIADGKSCNDLLLQFSAVQAALSKAAKIVLEEHFEHCIRDAIQDPDIRAEVDEFKKALDKYIH